MMFPRETIEIIREGSASNRVEPVGYRLDLNQSLVDKHDLTQIVLPSWLPQLRLLQRDSGQKSSPIVQQA